MRRLLVLNCLLAIIYVSALKSSPRILGGNEVDISEVPYQSAVEVYGFQFCAGVIISETYVLSSAQCLNEMGFYDVTVRLGTSLRQQGGTVINVTNFIQHPKYDIRRYDFDIAILELETPIIFDEKSQAITLTVEPPPTGSTVRVSGWGTTAEDEDPSLFLLAADIPVIDWQECLENYIAYGIPLSERMICAGETDKDSCSRDNGGPLVYNNTLVGIVSFGMGCGREGYPRVYTNISHPDIRDFIRNNTGI